jgi:hypothetical protein
LIALIQQFACATIGVLVKADNNNNSCLSATVDDMTVLVSAQALSDDSITTTITTLLRWFKEACKAGA